MQHARSVPLELRHPRQRGILPHRQLVLREAVAGDQLLVMWRPDNSTDLGLGIDRVDTRAARSVPEAQVSIGGTATSGQQIGLPRAPGESLDGGSVVVEGELGGPACGVVVIPDTDNVIITARRELGAIRTPLEAADLLLMMSEGGDMVVRDADIMVVDLSVTRARRENVCIPRESADPSGVRAHLADAGHAVGVPNLDLVAVGADGNVVAVGHPCDGGDAIVDIGGLAKLSDVARFGVPQIHGLPKGDGQDVVGAPVEQVEVVVLEQGGGVEDLGGILGDMSELVATHARTHGVLRVEDAVGVQVALFWLRGLV